MEDDEQVVVVDVELRALVPGVDVLPVERVEVEVLLEPLAVGEAGILDVDPAEATGLDDPGLGYLAAPGATATAAEAGRRRRGRGSGGRLGIDWEAS